MTEHRRFGTLHNITRIVPSFLQGEEIGTGLVFRLDEEQARLTGLQVYALIRAHRPFVSKPVPVDPGSDGIWIFTPKLTRDLHNGENLIERLAGNNPHPLAFTMMRKHLGKLDYIRWRREKSAARSLRQGTLLGEHKLAGATVRSRSERFPV